jgi:ABC-type transporter Mla subunit MlaD
VNAVADARGNVAATVILKKYQIIREDAVVTLNTNGIFGDSYIAFENAGLAGPELPRDDSAVMVAQKSFLGRTADKLGTLVERIDAIVDQDFVDNTKNIVFNLSAMSNDVAQISQAAADQRHRLAPMMDNVDQVLIAARHTLTGVQEELTLVRQRFDQVGQDLQPVLQEAQKAVPQLTGSLDEALVAARDALQNSQEELRQVREQLGPVLNTYGDFGEHLNAIMAEIRSGRGVIGQLLMSQALAQDMNNIVIDAQETSSRIADDPSLLLWGSNTEETAASRDRRERAQLRRSFDYGFGSPQLVPPAEEDPESDPRRGNTDSGKANSDDTGSDNAGNTETPSSTAVDK